MLGYKYKDVYFYVNGKLQELDGVYVVDFIYLVIEVMMKYILELFYWVGFEYVKMDFMIYGVMEVDKWYNLEI